MNELDLQILKEALEVLYTIRGEHVDAATTALVIIIDNRSEGQ